MMKPPGGSVSAPTAASLPRVPPMSARRPPCICGCGQPANGSSIYAAWACRARSKARRAPAPRPSEKELRRRLEAACIRQGTKPLAPLVRVSRTRDLGPATRMAYTPPAAPARSADGDSARRDRPLRKRTSQGGSRPRCRCGCGRPASASSGIYASPACRKQMKRTRGETRLLSKETGATG